MKDDRTSGSSLFDTKMTQPISIFILKKKEKKCDISVAKHNYWTI